MKPVYHSIFFCLWACLFLSACSDKEEVVNPSIVLSGSGSYVFDTEGGTQTLSFQSAKAWTASSGQGWCKVTPASGMGGSGSITLTVEENATYDERNTNVIIRSEGISQSIVVTQKQKDALTVTSNKLEVPAQEGTAEIEVKANVSYTCEIEESAREWISVSSSRALSSSKVVLRIAANEEMEKREGKVVVRSQDMEETVTVYQAAAAPTIVLSQNEYTVASQGETLTIQLRSNVSYQMIMPDGAPWLQVVESRAFSDYTHYIQVAANDTYGSRSAEIRFVNEAESKNEVVTIVQVQNDAIVVAQEEYVLDAVTTQLDFEVNANVEFDVSVSVDWMKQATESRALTAYPLSFEVEENASKEPREGVISLTAGDLKQDIRIVQKGRVDQGVLSVTHSNWEMVVPVITGRFLEGVVYWGDNTQEVYTENLSHSYSEKKEYTLRMELWGAEEVEFPNLVGVKEIDVSGL
ncbi:MAG: BACON domain-containing protein [Bacteroides sp.]|nr:BACON domain-containing protein [Bacteroides sp.]